jgi:hypothetical protein
MPPLSDLMLASGCVKHIGALNRETIEILEGAEAGQKFTANIIENQSDQVLVTEIQDTDARAVVMLRFDNALPKPVINKPTKIKREDGTVWTATKEDYSAFLTTDFKLIQDGP